MFQNRKFFSLISVFLALSLVITACSSPRQKFVGKWQNTQLGTTIEFFKDGTITVTSSTWGVDTSVTGSYRVLDDKSLRIDSSGGLFGGGSAVCQYSISGDTLKLTVPYLGTTQVIEYTRVK